MPLSKCSRNYDEFKEIESLIIKNYFDIVALSETLLTKNIKNKEINMVNYWAPLRCDSTSRNTGGVSKRISDFNNKWFTSDLNQIKIKKNSIVSTSKNFQQLGGLV